MWGRKYDQSCQDHADTNNVDNVGELCGALARSIQFISTPFLLMTSYFDPAITIIHGCEQTYEAQGDAALESFKVCSLENLIIRIIIYFHPQDQEIDN